MMRHRYMVVTYRVSSLLGLNVLEGDREVDEVKIDVSKTPSLVLSLGHRQGMISSVIVIPELGGDEDILTLHKAVLDGALDALTSLLLILVIVCSVEESVACLDSLCD